LKDPDTLIAFIVDEGLGWRVKPTQYGKRHSQKLYPSAEIALTKYKFDK